MVSKEKNKILFLISLLKNRGEYLFSILKMVYIYRLHKKNMVCLQIFSSHETTTSRFKWPSSKPSGICVESDSATSARTSFASTSSTTPRNSRLNFMSSAALTTSRSLAKTRTVVTPMRPMLQAVCSTLILQDATTQPVVCDSSVKEVHR